MPTKGILCVLFLSVSLLLLPGASHAVAQEPVPPIPGDEIPPDQRVPVLRSPAASGGKRILMPFASQAPAIQVQTTTSTAEVRTGERVTISSNIINASNGDVSANIVLHIHAPDWTRVYERTWQAQSIQPHQVQALSADFVPPQDAVEGRYSVEIRVTCARTNTEFFYSDHSGYIEVRRQPQPPANAGVYWGIAMKDIPWDMAKLENWEASAGKRMSIVHFWTFWNQGGTMQRFQTGQVSKVRAHGAIPMVSWPSEKMGGGKDQPDFRLREIINGRYDSYIRQWASDAKAWGQPFFLRYGHEMNGPFYAWGEDANGNKRGEFVQAWRHIHDIFTQVGSTNATWVWCPNVDFPGSPWPTVQSLYPGDDYVDWTCLDGYNWGEGSYNGWQTFDQVYIHSYNNILKAAPSKPMMIGEVGCSMDGDKPGWIRDAIGAAIPQRFPAVKAVVWYNWQFDGEDWRIESSSSSLNAFKEKIASPLYLANQYGDLRTSPVPAMR